MRNFIIIFSFLLPWYSATGSECTSEECVGVSQWQVGVALGLGVKTNPVSERDNIPLVILPDIAWYGESFFFDNGTFGYTFEPLAEHTFSLISQYNPEKSFFSFGHPDNVLSSLGGQFDQGLALPTNDRADKEDNDFPLEFDLDSRRWAWDAGVNWQWHASSGWLTDLSVLHDVSGVYQGSWVKMSFAKTWRENKWQWRLKLGSDWKSGALVDYYYGLENDEVSHTRYAYNGKASVDPFVSVDISRKIDKHWQWLASLGYQHLGDGVSDSPLITDKGITRLFLGAGYRF